MSAQLHAPSNYVTNKARHTQRRFVRPGLPTARSVVPTKASNNGVTAAVTVLSPPAVQNGAAVFTQMPEPEAETQPLSLTEILASRHRAILQYFPNALGADDFLARVEVALCKFGFTGDTSIAMTNLCRDEVTSIFKDKIESVFGSSFNTNGLGAVLTCGATGIGAGLSHSPVCAIGRERYVFFSFPHIGIDGRGTLGSINRPGRPGTSCACGALAKSLAELQKEGADENCKGVRFHDPVDPEYSILKQRLARRLFYEQLDVNLMNLADLTALAERCITDDLELLVRQCVDTTRADYAVVTGVQVHSWGQGHEAHLEFVAPSRCYVVVRGQRTNLDLARLPALTPRQISLMAAVSMGQMHAAHAASGAAVITETSSFTEIEGSYLSKRLGAPML